MGNQKARDISESLSDVRKELDGKIDRKVSYEVFKWVAGGIVILALGAYAYVWKVSDKHQDKIENLQQGQSSLEARMNNVEKRQDLKK